MSSTALKNVEPIPGYRLRRRIGAGGYGEVWEADAPGELLKAVKIVYGLMDEDRATREAKALQRIKSVRHPFILSLERIEIVDGQLIIVTELAECSLKDRFDQVRKEGKHGLSRDEVLRHMRDAADALDFMTESYSLQHLDVKPENMLLVGGRVKIADFGLVKDVHDCSVSMMGGLTPIYAPPELFEGRPSRRSDQYSLAIVFQEMLTGVLPFPGKTAAQLANQHLNAKPRLSVLPESDQAVIARALSKNPADRFDSCRELIDHLTQAEEVAARLTQAREAQALSGDSVTQGMTESRAAVEKARANRAPGKPAEAVRREAEMLGDLELAEEACQSRESIAAPDADAAILHCIRPGELHDCDPVSREGRSLEHQPTLIIGIGGLAGKVLNACRRRLEDSETPLAQRPQMLLLDSDGRDLMRASREAGGAALAPEETIHLSLRRPQDYRDGSRQILSWLSRRWLYNIPRSLQTEGVRPLGRLALVDHGDEVWSRLRKAIAALLERKPQGRSAEPPRVILLAALGGGTGSGAALDLALMVRQVLDEQKLANAELIAGLIHAVPAGAQPQQLAAANVASALAEWQSVLADNERTPGDLALKLKPRSTYGAVNHCYLLQFGAGFADSPAVDAVAPLANWLWLETASSAAPSLRMIRNLDPPAPGVLPIRTLGVAARSALKQDLVETQALRLCFHLMQRWQGTPLAPRKQQRTTGLLSGLRMNAATGDMTTEAMLDRVEQSAALFAQGQRISPDELHQDAIAWAVNEFHMPAESFFAEIPKAVAQQHNGPTGPSEKWLVAVNEIFGAPPNELNPTPPPGAIQDSLAEGVRARANALGRRLAQWVEGLLNQPIGRLLAAQRAQKTITALLKAVVEKLRERRAQLVDQMHAADSAFRGVLLELQTGKPRTKNAPPLTPEAAFQQVCWARLNFLGLQQAVAIAQGAIGSLGACNDGLFDLSRELRSLSSVFFVEEVDEHSEDPLRELAKQRLDEALPELAELFDQRLSEQWLAPSAGLKPFMAKELADRDALIGRLQDEARRLVLDTLRSYDLAGAVSEVNASTGGGPWRAVLSEARPALGPCGGDRRLLCILPATAPTDPEVWRRLTSGDGFQREAELIRSGASEITFCYEIGGIAIAELLDGLLDGQPDLAEAADRLHTRSDLTWPQIQLIER